MAGHTSGPWELDRYGTVIDRSGKSILVDGVALPTGNHPRIEEAVANARLVAAAPDLLAALQAMRSYCVPGMDFTGEYWRELQAKADAAIAKALHG